MQGVSANNVGRILVSMVVVCGFMATTYLFLTAKWAGQQPSETLTLLVGALASNFTSVVSYWIGSSSGSSAKDDSANRVTEHLAQKAVVPVPVAVPRVVTPVASGTPWWSVLTDEEKAGIEKVTATDTQASAFYVQAQVGAADSADLDYLVSRGLLTAERAAEIRKIT